jgi:hypothetical protein
MHLFSLFLHPDALELVQARLAPHRLHVVARDEAEARRVAADEAFAVNLVRQSGALNPWTDPKRAGCALFAPSLHPFIGEARRVGRFGPLEQHGTPQLTSEMRLARIHSLARRIEGRPVSDEEIAAEAWELSGPDGATAFAWKQLPIFAAHPGPGGLELFRFPCEDQFFRLS